MRAFQAHLGTSVAVSLVLFIPAIIFYLEIGVLHVNADRLAETGGEVKWPIENDEETLEFCHERITTKAASTHNQEKGVEETRLEGDVEVKKNLAALFGTIDERYASAIVTDKPVYRPGDCLYARGLTFGLENGSQFEQGFRFHGQFHFTIRSPRGDTIYNSYVPDLWFFYRIPEDIAGGYYTLECWGSSEKIAPSHRTFQVQAYRAPQLLISLETTRDLYAYGETIIALLTVGQLHGGAPKGATVTAVVRIDGREVYRSDALVLPPWTGKLELEANLPSSWDCGVGTLTVTILTQGGGSESKTITVPLAVPKLQVDLYPEGGVVVSGLPTTLYAMATLPNGEPGYVEGEVVSLPDGQPLAFITTSHEGRGRSSRFIPPELTTGLEFRVTHPLHMNVSLEPELFSMSGATLLALEDSYGPQSSVKLAVACTSSVSQPLRLGLYKKELELVSTNINLGMNKMLPVELIPPPTTLGWGVLRVTLYDAASVPIAERLIYREPDSWLNVKLSVYVHTPENDDHPVEGFTAAPASTIRLKASVTDQNYIPVVNATVGVTVSDMRPWTAVQERHLPPRLLQALVIEPEVEELMDPNAFPLYNLDEYESQRYDLLLGTQGWRRFIYKDPMYFLENGTGEKILRHSVLGVGMKQQSNIKMFAGVMRATAMNIDFDGELEAVSFKAVEEMMDADDTTMYAGGEVVSDDEVVQEAPDENTVMSDEEIQEEPKLGRYAGSNERIGMKRTINMMDIECPHGYDRVYAHRRRSAPQSLEDKDNILTRSDFVETVFFAAELRTDNSGVAMADFDLSESITKYVVHVDAMSQDGDVGSASLNNLTASLPVSVGVTLPPFLTEEDFIEVSISSTVLLQRNLRGKQSNIVLNADIQYPLHYQATTTSEKNGELWIREEHSNLNNDDSGTTTVTASIMQSVESLRTSLPIEVGHWVGEHDQGTSANLTCYLTLGNWRDSVSLSTVILPKGFSVRSTGAGSLSRASTVGKLRVLLPEDLVKGSARVSFSVYPSVVASLTKSLEAIIREPCGCFEQLSAATYPMVLALAYFNQQSPTSVPDGLVAKAISHLESGLKKLLSYEVETGGFEWFGRSPAHEALSAYAVLQFTDMREVLGGAPRDVVDRTTKWVLSRADGDGGFLQNPKALDSFGYAPVTVSNLFILYALLSASVSMDEPTIKAGISALKNRMPISDTYELALAGLVLDMAGDKYESTKAAQVLIDMQDDDGRVPDAARSITNSIGESLDVETTALSTLAWMSLSTNSGSSAYVLSVEKGVRWLMERCKDGMYGSTQGTVLTLKAILQYNRLKAQSIPNSKLSLALMDGKEELASTTIYLGGGGGGAADSGLQPLSFDSKDIEAVLRQSKEYSLVLTQDVSNPNTNDDGKTTTDTIADWTLPWSGIVSWRSIQPPSSSTSPLVLETSISNGVVQEGESVEICVVVALSANFPPPSGMVVARVGIPAGLEPRMDRLREFQKEGTIDSFELLNSDVILYWDGILPGNKVITCFDTRAIVLGSYTGKASRAWLYYADSDSEYWENPIRVRIVPFSASL